MISNNNDFSWLDNIILEHKSNLYSNDKNSSLSNDSIGIITKENLDLKSQLNTLNEIIEERDQLKEINKLKEREILLLEQKVQILNKALKDSEFNVQIRDEVYDYFRRINSIFKQIYYEENNTNENINYVSIFHIRERFKAIENCIYELKEQNFKLKEEIEALQQKCIQMDTINKELLYERNNQMHYSSCENYLDNRAIRKENSKISSNESQLKSKQPYKSIGNIDIDINIRKNFQKSGDF